jgi:hypothetical protein
MVVYDQVFFLPVADPKQLSDLGACEKLTCNSFPNPFWHASLGMG